MTIEATDPDVPWIANYLETRLSHLWYTCTVATVAFNNRHELEKCLLKEGLSPECAAPKAKIAGRRGALPVKPTRSQCAISFSPCRWGSQSQCSVGVIITNKLDCIFEMLIISSKHVFSRRLTFV